MQVAASSNLWQTIKKLYNNKMRMELFEQPFLYIRYIIGRRVRREKQKWRGMDIFHCLRPEERREEFCTGFLQFLYLSEYF